MRNITLITLFVGASAFITSAYAEISGNIGVTSNYLWRGTTQSSDESAVSGGLDYASESYYAGVWLSEADWADGISTEVDLYVGTDINGFDVGIIKYMYPGARANDFTEAYVGYSISGFDLSYAFDIDTSDNEFYSISYGFDIVEGVTGTITFGDYSFADSTADYDYTQLDVAYGDLTITYSDGGAEDTIYAVSYGWGL